MLLHEFTRSDTNQIAYIVHSHIFTWYSYGNNQYIVAAAGGAIPVKESLDEIKEKWLKAEGEKDAAKPKSSPKHGISKKRKAGNKKSEE